MGPGELVIILVVVILLFGAKKIPDLAKGIGIGIREFKKAFSEHQDTDTTDKNSPPSDRTEKK